MTTPTTGWAPGMLQDDSRGLSKWLADKPDALQHVKALESLIAKLMKSADSYAHVYAFVGDDTMPKMRAALEADIREAISQPVTDLERYIAANYPDARGETIAARVIDALETMDIALGMREIAQPVPGAPA